MELMDRRYDRGQRSAVVTGIVLVLIGALALMAQFIPGLGLMVWAAALAAGGALIVGVYFTDRSQPGVLIPGCVLGAISGLLWLIGANILRGRAIPAYVMFSIALPFLTAFLVKREN